MVALKLEQFGGMIPALNDYYLPPNQAALSENAWVYTGALEGFHVLQELYTCSSQSVRKVFRIPLGFYDKDRISNSYWMEFDDPDTDVVRSPIADDEFERFYWASSSHSPLYNPRNRITGTKSGTVTFTIGSSTIGGVGSGLLTVGDPVTFSTTGTLPTGLVAGQNYFVSSVTVTDFTVSAVPGGANVTLTGTQSGVHTLNFNAPLKLGVPAPSAAPAVDHTPRNSTVTIIPTTPATVTFTAGSKDLNWTSHGLFEGDPFFFTSVSGALPEEIDPDRTYYVTAVIDGNTVRFARGRNGEAIAVAVIPTGGVYNAFKSSTITWASHDLTAGDTFFLTTTGTLPTGLVPNTEYFVLKVTGQNTFTLSASDEGRPIVVTSAGTGVIKAFDTSDLAESRTYIYTWESAYGEEGPPSNPSPIRTCFINGSTAITLQAPTNAEAEQRNLKYANIYRAVTAASGAATYFFVAQLPVGTTTYTDVVTNVSSNNQLQSLYWEPPPEDLEGMVTMPNGIIAGFRRNEVYFCEPYRPHAWPTPYVLSVDYPVIGLGVIGQTLIVCTAVSPYAISGVNPAVMSMSRISVIAPCSSRGSVVSTPLGVIYSSPDGLAVATPAAVTIATKELVTKDKWQEFLPVPTLRGVLFNNAYYCWGSAQGVTFNQEAFQIDAFQGVDVTGGYSGAFIDFQNQRVSYNTLKSEIPALNVFSDPWSGEVLVLRDGKVYWLDLASSRPRDRYKWRSKVFSMPNRRSIEAMRVWFETYPDSPVLNPVRNTSLNQTLQPDQWGLVRVYADGRLVMCRELRTDGEMMRLPSGFKAATYQVEIEARIRIIGIEMATSAKELINV